ncbi:MAG: hypothetical protein ACE5K0_04345, partial [Candidatus Methanofastidiosia archaeon]
MSYKLKRIFILLFTFILIFQAMVTSQLTLRLWIDKGCDSAYHPGETITIFYEANQNTEVTLYEILPDGTTHVIFQSQSITAHTTYQYSTKVNLPYGTETLRLVSGAVFKECFFFISAASGSLRLESNISGYSLFLDGKYVLTEGEAPDEPDGVVFLKNLALGTHTITLKKKNCTSEKATFQVHADIQADIQVTMTCMQDEDEDGIPDSEDECYNPDCAIVDERGCPKDSDVDGISDCEDECPYDFGLKERRGCSELDSDRDGIPDSEDECYNPDCAIVDE